MINIKNSNLIDIIPPNLRNDPDMIAACKAVDKQFLITASSLDNIILLPNIDNVKDHKILDLLAWELHIDYYDDTLPIETKIELIKTANVQHRLKGTPAAIEELITIIFGYGEVLEWFEYGGEPYHFKVVTSNPSATTEKAQQFIKLINTAKRKSAVLDSVELTMTESLSINIGAIVHTGDTINLKQVM